MGILEVSVEMMNLSGAYDFTSPQYQLFSFIFLIAALFLALRLRTPRKGDHWF
jgi:hypothetical protein